MSAFVEAATPPRTNHTGGSLDSAERILKQHPSVDGSNIYVAALLGDEAAVRNFLAQDPAAATKRGGPRGWDALTHLCFSRYLKLDSSRSQAFVRTARLLLDAGADPNTGWHEPLDLAGGPIFEKAIYGASCVARHAGVTRLLLERGADPNDDETPYHSPESYDNTVMTVLLDGGKLNAVSLSWMLLRKTDIHDLAGLRLLLEHGADPNKMTCFKDNSLHHAIRRDNSLPMIEALLDYGADPTLWNERDGRSAFVMAARRGRADVLSAIERRGGKMEFRGVEEWVAACARGDSPKADDRVEKEISEQGGTLLAEFAGVGNLAGVRSLLDAGVPATALYREGDPYFDIAKDSTALHVAAWRAWPEVVKELIAYGAPVNAEDGKGRTALVLAVKACVDSYWTHRRTPESVRALLEAGASTMGVAAPCGYDAVDMLLRGR